MITKSAMITICGRPNVGKSTLTNALVGEKIAIVSNKPQTTRNRITAIVERGETQFVLMGRYTDTTQPHSSAFSIIKEPPWRVTISSHTARPMPVPRFFELPL